MDIKLILLFLETKGEKYWAGSKYRLIYPDSIIDIYWQNTYDEILTIFANDEVVFKMEEGRIKKCIHGTWERRMMEKIKNFLNSYPKYKQRGMGLKTSLDSLENVFNQN